MNFARRAELVTKFGIPVFPCNPRDKFPASGLSGWPEKATTDPEQITKWNEENADYNTGLVAKAEPGGFLFLEFDIEHGMKLAAAEMGQEIPVTRAHRSGKGFGHWIFQHTEKSIALGNVSATLPTACTCDKIDKHIVCKRAGCVERAPHHHHEWFSLRAHRRYVVGPLSVHPNGNLYTVVKNMEPTPIPDWLLEFAKEHGSVEVERRGGSNKMPRVVDDFDFDDFCDHYSEILGDVTAMSGDYHVPEICPGTYSGEGTGRHHENSVRSGFFYDGEHLGFHCFAQGCDASSWNIGEVIAHMNQYVGRYPKPIWEETDGDWGDIDDLTDEMYDTDSDTEDDDEKPEPVTVEVKAEPVIAEPKEGVSPEELLQVIADDNRGGVTQLNYPELRFPIEALPEGRFKQLLENVCEGGLSAGLAAPALMSLASAIPIQDEMDGARINLFVCLLSLVGAGKDTSIDRSIKALGLERYEGEVWTSYAPSGERSVSNLLGDHPPKKGETQPRPGFSRHIMVTYELEDTLRKAKGESSSVLQMIQHLYDHNHKTFSDSRTGSKQRVNCRTSWLTALPVGSEGRIDEDAFRRTFGENTTHGLLSRMLFGFAEERFDRRRTRNWQPNPVTETKTSVQKALGVDDVVEIEEYQVVTLYEKLTTGKVKGWAPGVEEQFLNWTPERNASGRDTYHVQKVAIITALLNGHSLIEQGDWEFAVAFLGWQEKIRSVFSAGRTPENSASARMMDRIMSTIERKSEEMVKKGTPREDCWFRWKGLSHDGKWHLYGVDIKRLIEQLVEAGALVYRMDEKTFKDGGKGEPEVNKRYVRLCLKKSSIE